MAEIWRPNETGILIPGKMYDSSNRSRTTVISVRNHAEEIENLYKTAGILIPATCGLAKLIEKTKILAERWESKKIEGTSHIDIFHVLHLLRIIDAVLPLSDVQNKEHYLKSLTSGELNFFERTPSKAKNILWELELWSLLRKRGAQATLKDPPDIVLNLSGIDLSIACKKIYSENNVSKVLSEAVEQVESSGNAGIAAINIDELTTGRAVLKARTEKEMVGILLRRCEIFLENHERHFRRYLKDGRIVAALISVHVVADVQEWNVPYNNSRQTIIWAMPGLDIDKEIPLEQFRRLIVD